MMSRRTVVAGAAFAANAGGVRAALGAQIATPAADLSENTRKAIAVLESLESGDAAAVMEYISADTYIQHNLDFPSGRQALLDALPMLKDAGTTVTVHRVLEDGDLVALHSKYFIFGKPMIGFDVFRFENGVIVEHWDNLQETITDTASGRSMIDGPTDIIDLDKTEENRALVRGAVEDVLIGGQFDRITEFVSAETYNQHNPLVEDGLEGLSRGMAALAEAGNSISVRTLHQVIAEGNFVLTMSDGTFGDEPAAFYDLFRVEDGRIVEHWDVIQPIPPQADWKNENGKF